MKRRSLYFIMFLMLFALIGGVFATWKYADETEAIDDKKTALEVAAAECGEFKVTSNTLKITVDQADAEYNAKLVGEGNIIIEYTQKGEEEAPAGVITVTVENAGESGISANTPNTIDFTFSGTTATITVDQVIGALKIEKVLATKAEYDAYSVKGVVINLNIAVK